MILRRAHAQANGACTTFSSAESRRLSRRGASRGNHERPCHGGIEQWSTCRDPAARVKQHAQRLLLGHQVQIPSRQRRTVGQRGAGSHDDGLRCSAELVGVGSRHCVGVPARRAVCRGCLTIDADGCFLVAIGAAQCVGDASRTRGKRSHRWRQVRHRHECPRRAGPPRPDPPHAGRGRARSRTMSNSRSRSQHNHKQVFFPMCHPSQTRDAQK